MVTPLPDSTRRFSDRVANYVRYRPTYPTTLLQALRDDTGLTPAAVIADIGSGTGISSQLFLANRNTVLGIEPNTEMRQVAESLFEKETRFRSIAARAEATTLDDASVDYVVAGQAFHWFDQQAARREFVRILRPGGWVVLFWNTRRINASELSQAYEDLLKQFAIDYREVDHKNIGRVQLQAFYAGGKFTSRSFDNEQWLDYEGLQGRLLSSSYTPTATQPGYHTMLAELRRIFDRFETNGQVAFEYDTELYFGHVS